MGNEEKDIYVYASWVEEAELVGILHASKQRGKETFSFEYTQEFLEAHPGFTIDPSLDAYTVRQYPSNGKNLFGAFEDSSPDRWGRVLMRRREAILAHEEMRKPSLLTESDYFLGVCDETRMGALRFKLDPNEEYVSSDKRFATPPWTDLRVLETASIEFENQRDPNEIKWLRQLLSPGSSLGGARPKASVVNPDGSLWIAKFPSRYDECNIGAWETVTHNLAVKCGLDVPQAQIANFSKNGSTFLVKRFDRDGNRRIHTASAMTMLGKSDGEEGVSYLDLADKIIEVSSCPEIDLRELWNRIVFSMAVSNTDDHLRNHGFIYKDNGWRLSPLYDVNPVNYGDWLSLNVDKVDSTIDFNLAISVANDFEVTKDEARDTVNRIAGVVRESWKPLAEHYGISREETMRMAPAFQEAEIGLKRIFPVKELEQKKRQCKIASSQLNKVAGTKQVDRTER